VLLHHNRCSERPARLRAPARAPSARGRRGADILWNVAKYDPLFEVLCRAADGPVSLTFDEIERLVGPLPASASKFTQWWENESTGGRHVQARAWLNAGREVEHVDLSRRTVRFSTAGWRRSS
jgi:hypothetical protein